MALQRGVRSAGVDLVCGLGAYVVALWWRYGGASKSLNAGEVIETWGDRPSQDPKSKDPNLKKFSAQVNLAEAEESEGGLPLSLRLFCEAGRSDDTK